MKLLGSSEKDIDQDKNGELVPKTEVIDVVSMHCTIVNNTHQQASKVLLTFVSNEQFGQLITIEAHSLTMLKTTRAEFYFIEVWFTDRNNRPFEVEDNVSITLTIGTDYENRLLNKKKQLN